jgi:hypothetical protein
VKLTSVSTLVRPKDFVTRDSRTTGVSTTALTIEGRWEVAPFVLARFPFAAWPFFKARAPSVATGRYPTPFQSTD